MTLGKTKDAGETKQSVKDERQEKKAKEKSELNQKKGKINI